MNITQIIAQELSAKPQQIDAAVALLDDGATVPFIARYRKEVTGGLDDTQLRTLAERLSYLRELGERRATILNSIEEQGKLTPELQSALNAADTKTALEDLYLPYKLKRRTKAQMAREAGLQPLADSLLQDAKQLPEAAAKAYVSDKVADVEAALAGARAILIEQFAENATLLGELREKLWRDAELHATVAKDKAEEGEKFKDYFDHRERLCKMPSHRALAVLRGQSQGLLKIALKYQADDAPNHAVSEFEQRIAGHFDIADRGRPADTWLLETVRQTWKSKLFPSLSKEALNRLKESADSDAISVFANNLKDLLLAAPAGRLTTLGLDPGYRTGIKVAVVDDTGKVIDTGVVYLHKENQALSTLAGLIKRHGVQLIAIGNGTASRETDKLAGDLVKMQAGLHKMVVSEAGASVYSASELAAKEFPDLDVSLRGAVSIARRLQDPLAELVKIDPKSIGVGQYQHDVNQNQLAHSLDAVVEDCVNAVGVDVNTASAPLLARISGLNKTLANNIVAFRDENGAFDCRKRLLKVPRLGAKTYEQAAGFLRIHAGSEPLDASAVHPEAYPIVAKMLKDQGVSAEALIGNRDKLARIKPNDYTTEQFGLPTIRDILAELEKPGRDPRGEFQTAAFAEGVNEISDLEVGMVLEGVVSNVANFGAFVDIGVHQDGLVHISALSNRFVSDPREVVKAGDVVKVKVLSVDEARKRIELTMRLDDAGQSNQSGKSGRAGQSKPAGNGNQRHSHKQDKRQPRRSNSQQSQQHGNTAMAAAFAQLKKR
ncbi:MAG: RNA-binding transcriptional accessory protein [Gammaproteobacteria bacterium]|nr:MAG: RNA-binding transcriptional accessory protein [Gammaproteobacteria bacterium]